MSAATTITPQRCEGQAAGALALPHGLHERVSDRVYHERVLGLASKSALDLVHRSPAHYRAWVDGHEPEPTPALLFGSAFHCALLEPDRFRQMYAAEPDFGDCRFKENKARRDEWRRDNAGRKLISAADMATIKGMVAAVRAHRLASRMVRDGEPELTVRWRDEETGLECKLRADYYVKAHRMLVDVKSTDDASDRGFAKSIAHYGYHRQDAFYRRGFEAIGEPIEHFVFVAVEKAPPYAIGLYTLDEDALQRGAESIWKDMLTLAECLQTKAWPAYEPGIQQLSLPRWAA